MSEIVFTEDEQDLFKELINVAYGNSTAAIADILDRFATLNIPEFKIYSQPEVDAYLQKHSRESNVNARQSFTGEFSGESMLFLDQKSVKNLALVMDVTDEENIYDAILELMNILNSTLISRLASELGTDVSFSIPSLFESVTLEKNIDTIIRNYNQAMIIHTVVEFKDEQICGEVAVFTKDSSIIWIHNMIKKMVEDLS